ncbi:hypothetical protein E3Q08_03514 [Wallemia mellicola]|uniref:Uncharacterized protein n=1 Tax=Wallemia mellicola TaxID=1708541 RepID=A0AB38MFF7_9BASI|nr:hypothetical protein E3Q24_00964 [Wallemia mellicola]TIB82262.1 hypothetical protein E3Q21_03477 [Wallemia mellicola]TIB84985.1 hypothetical protein E3Q20_03432 [Wallemia mellicola]TIC03251.1 hypothetical protein E3Q16_03116 [Wallemia mellicola]TIC09600.1 hypothetical protein E3Q15_03439 [Wallemia mellicola]
MDYHGEYILKAQKYKSNLLLYKKNAEKPTFQIDTNSWRAKFTLIELPNNVLSHAKMRKWTLSRVYDVTIDGEKMSVYRDNNEDSQRSFKLPDETQCIASRYGYGAGSRYKITSLPDETILASFEPGEGSSIIGRLSLDTRGLDNRSSIALLTVMSIMLRIGTESTRTAANGTTPMMMVMLAGGSAGGAGGCGGSC